MDLKEKKILITYFSRAGENYLKGKIVDLKVGNTEIFANMIGKLTKGDIFKIETVEEYPYIYNECTDFAKKEQRNNARPILKGDISTDNYDIIFIGYPNWWGTMPMALWSFLEKHNLSNKILIPFCTHEGSGMGSSEKDIKNICRNAECKVGLAIYGSNIKNAEEDIRKWLYN